MARTYLLSFNRETGETVLPWISLVMASLMLNDRPMSKKDIALDICQNKEEQAKLVAGSVNSAVNKLEEMYCVSQLKNEAIKVSSLGKKRFTPYLNETLNRGGLSGFSDSKWVKS